MRNITLRFVVILCLLGCACATAPSTPDVREPVTTSLGPTLRVSGRYAPRAVHRVEPIYAPAARHEKTTGAVVLDALIDVDGNVAGVQVVRGLPNGLTESAVEAVRQWKFAPTLDGGQPVPVLYEISVGFSLN